MKYLFWIKSNRGTEEYRVMNVSKAHNTLSHLEYLVEKNFSNLGCWNQSEIRYGFRPFNKTVETLYNKRVAYKKEFSKLHRKSLKTTDNDEFNKLQEKMHKIRNRKWLIGNKLCV